MTWMIWGYPYCRKPLVDHDMEEHHIILEPPWRVDVDPFIGILVRRLFGRTKDPVSRLPLEFLSTWSSLQIQVAAVRSVFSSQNFKTPTIESIFWGVPNEKNRPKSSSLPESRPVPACWSSEFNGTVRTAPPSLPLPSRSHAGKIGRLEASWEGFFHLKSPANCSRTAGSGWMQCQR